MKMILGLLTALLLVSPVMAETALYCQEKAHGGVTSKYGQMTTTTFLLERHTFLLSDDRRTLKINIGEDYRRKFHCKEDYREIECNDDILKERVVLTKNLRRFFWVRMNGLVLQTDVKEYWAHISIGTCEKF